MTSPAKLREHIVACTEDGRPLDIDTETGLILRLEAEERRMRRDRLRASKHDGAVSVNTRHNA